jgi:Ca2+-binding RTX toxin-like protein
VQSCAWASRPLNAYDYVVLDLLERDQDPLRTISDDSGQWSFFLPPRQAIRYAIFDPVSGLISQGFDTTAPSGQRTSLTGATFRASTANDTDGDGLPDDIEHAIGTSPFRQDSNTDGLSDFSAIRNGEDPLAGFSLPIGIIGSLNLQGRSLDIAALPEDTNPTSRLALVAIGTGLAVVDLSNALSPNLLSRLPLSGNADSVAYDHTNRLAAVATGGSLAILDLSTPTTPILQRAIAVAAEQVEVLDGIAYLITGGELRSHDLTTGNLLTTLPLGAALVGLARAGTTLYARDAQNRIHVVQATGGGGELLTLRGSLQLPSSVGNTGERKLFAADGILYLPADDGFQGGFATVDVRNPTAPILLSGPDDRGLAGRAIALTGSGRAVIVGSPGGVFGTNVADVINTSDVMNTGALITRVNLPSRPNDVAIVNGLAVVATDAGLQVVNVLPRDVNGVAPTLSINTTGLDANPGRPGIQVREGAILPLSVSLSDDVLVSTVDVLVNGQVSWSDNSYPFDWRVNLPTIVSNGGTTVTVRARATDSGGTIGLSNPVTLELTPDSIAPTLLSSTPSERMPMGRTARTLTLLFSEPVRFEQPVEAVFQLLDATNNSIPFNDAIVRGGGRQLQLNLSSPPPEGPYRLQYIRSLIRDLAGNALGTGLGRIDFIVSPYDQIIIGSESNEKLTGGEGNDFLNGLAGGDMLYGYAGNDVLLGGENSDQLFGGAGNDLLDVGNGWSEGEFAWGEAGDDTLIGGNGSNPFLSGGDGNDQITLGSGGGRAYGDKGNDLLIAGTSVEQRPQLFGGEGDDQLRLNNAQGSANGESGNDDLLATIADGGDKVSITLNGGYGNDRLTVSGTHNGSVSLNGGGGLDVLSGSAGNDELNDGDPEWELAVFNPLNGHWYQMIEPMTVDEALAFAASRRLANRQGYLVTITHPWELGFLSSQFNLSFSNSRILLGASDAEEEGTWRWLGGPEVGEVFYVHGQIAQPGYANWRLGQPDSLLGEEDFAVQLGPRLGWDDIPRGSDRWSVVVEYGGTEGDGIDPFLQPGDTLLAGAGNDTLQARGDNDLIDGGPGTDTLYLYLTQTTADLTLYLTDPSLSQALPGGGSIIDIERFYLVVGDGDHTILLGPGDDTVRSGAGDDVIDLGDGDGQAIGGDGNDHLS